MRKLIVVVGLLVLLLAVAIPASASDGSLLGSGGTAPDNDKVAAEPVDSGPDVVHVVRAAGQDALATTGLESGTVLLLGFGLMTAGAAAVVTSRKRARL